MIFSVLFMPYNKSFTDQASSVKMAGYWPRPLLAFLSTSTSSRSIKTQKENSANIQPSWPRAWSIIYTYCSQSQTLEMHYTVEPRLSGPRLSGLFLVSQFGHEYLLVTIKVCSHILFKTTALKGAVKCEGFLLSKSKSSARACRN